MSDTDFEKAVGKAREWCREPDVECNLRETDYWVETDDVVSALDAMAAAHADVVAEVVKFKYASSLLASQITYKSKACPDCNPDHVISPDPTCARCGGSGYIRYTDKEFVEWAVKEVEMIRMRDNSDVGTKKTDEREEEDDE